MPTLTLRRRYPWFDSDAHNALVEKESACRVLKRDRGRYNTLDILSECSKTFKKLSCLKYRQYLRNILETLQFQIIPSGFRSFRNVLEMINASSLPTLLDGTSEMSVDVGR